MKHYGAIRDDVSGALSSLECMKLGSLAQSTSATAALEVGNYFGLSTCVLLSALPRECSLVTIDHHRGDDNCGATQVETFLQNISHYRGERDVTVLTKEMRGALTDLLGAKFGFVFYDADHTETGVADFWARARYLLADECTLVFDDADWPSQHTLVALAENDGFVVQDRPNFWRCETSDKANDDTFTLEVMCRA